MHGEREVSMGILTGKREVQVMLKEMKVLVMNLFGLEMIKVEVINGMILLGNKKITTITMMTITITNTRKVMKIMKMKKLELVTGDNLMYSKIFKILSVYF